jgi:hypothetical protein
VTDQPHPGNRADLPPWAGPHWPVLLVWNLAGVPPEEQIRLLRTQGLQPERALRLALSVPPLSPRGQRERVRLGAQLLFGDPGRFWQVVESLSVYWGIHPWSIMGEPLPYDFHHAWCAELGCRGSRDGLVFSGAFGQRPRVPGFLCARRIELDQVALVRLPKGWIVEDLVLRNCTRLRGSLADVTVLHSTEIFGCPLFDSPRELDFP